MVQAYNDLNNYRLDAWFLSCMLLLLPTSMGSGRKDLYVSMCVIKLLKLYAIVE